MRNMEKKIVDYFKKTIKLGGFEIENKFVFRYQFGL